MRILIPLILVLFLLPACSQYATYSTHSPTAEEVLIQNPEADIFQYNGIIYINASDTEWVQQTEITIGNVVGTITDAYKKRRKFKNGMATKLPIGTEIFDVNGSGQLLIIKSGGKEIKYSCLIEG